MNTRENDNTLQIQLDFPDRSRNWLHVQGLVLWGKSRSRHLATFSQRMILCLVKMNRDKLQCLSKASKPWSLLIHRREKCQMKRICHPLPVLTFLKTFKTDPELLSANRSTNTFSYCTITKECLEMKRPEVKTLVKAWSEIQRVKGISYNLGHLI